MLFAVNIVLTQFGWLASVLGGANQMPWVGPVGVVAIVGLHLWFAKRPAAELALVLCCGAIGTVFDSLLVTFGWVSYPSGTFATGLAPYWIIAMWMLFATTLNVSLRWLHDRSGLAAVLGLIAGPLTYIAGAKLGGIVFVDRFAALATLALGWAVIMPALIRLAQRLDGFGGVGLAGPASFPGSRRANRQGLR